VKIKCNIITPMLMHGENTKITELRPPSIKGAMRFWWRAIHGNLLLKRLIKKESQNDLFLEYLREEEAKIFGSKEKRSPFRIKIKSNNLENEKFKILDYEDLIQQDLKIKGLKENEIKKRISKYQKTKINGFVTNQKFEIEILGDNLEYIKKIFILSTILGGFGQRSRRGFGKIEITKIDEDDFKFELTKTNIINLIKEINPDFDFNIKNNYPFIRQIEISSKKYSSYKEALKWIGYYAHKYKDNCIGSANPRFASPLYTSVLKINTKYVPIVTTLNIYSKCVNNVKQCIQKIENFKKDIL